MINETNDDDENLSR